MSFEDYKFMILKISCWTAPYESAQAVQLRDREKLRKYCERLGPKIEPAFTVCALRNRWASTSGQSARSISTRQKSFGMLLSSLYEVGRKNVWTCVHCSVKNPCRMLVASTKTRSHPSSSHQRRSSSSKSLPPPKSEHRTIDTPSETPTATKLPTAEVTKRSSTRLRRRHRDTVRDPGTKNSETWPSLPSVPSTQHLHPLG